MRTLFGLVIAAVIVCGWVAMSRADRPQTVYTMPEQIQWTEDRGEGVPRGSFYTLLHGKESDACGQV